MGSCDSADTVDALQMVLIVLGDHGVGIRHGWAHVGGHDVVERSGSFLRWVVQSFC